mgnify:CR=1 FL=1
MKSDILVIKSIFLFFSFWGITVLLLWFRPRIEIFWKAVATLILAFYVWFFFPELKAGFYTFKGAWYVSSLDFLREILTIIFAGLFIIWPATLIRIFYKADDIGAEKLLKFLCLLTLVLWVLFIIYFFFSSGIDSFFYENLRKMVPHAK